MPRAIWSGAISFGLVNIPVKLYSAVSRKTVQFNQLDGETGSRIRQKRVNAESGEEVPFAQIVKGYELGEGRYVTITDEELSSLDPEATRSIDLQEFVLQAEIDPVFYDAAYYLVPDQGARKAYALLVEAMSGAGRVGLAKFVMRTKQYLAAMRPVDGVLMLSTMVYADEINPASSIDGLDDLADIELTAAERAMAQQLIESLSADFEPEKYEDDYRNRVLELIDRKANGEEIVMAAEGPAPTQVVDLMAALEASVAAAKEARKRHPAAGAEATAKVKERSTRTAAKSDASAEAAPRKTRAKKAS
jgi:DNA end-binding protein Ku